MGALAAGFAGGLIATLGVTALARLLAGGTPLPEAALWATYVASDDDPAAHERIGLVLHLLYGTVVGGGYGAGVALFGRALPLSPTTLLGGIVWGAAYGFGLYLVALGFWFRIVVPSSARPTQAITFLVFHLNYGLVLGLVVGAGA